MHNMASQMTNIPEKYSFFQKLSYTVSITTTKVRKNTVPVDGKITDVMPRSEVVIEDIPAGGHE